MIHAQKSKLSRKLRHHSCDTKVRIPPRVLIKDKRHHHHDENLHSPPPLLSY
jgi:hypothetical protein